MDSETTIPNDCRSLVLIFLARQLQIVPIDALIAAAEDWVANKQEPLGEVLVRRQACTRDARQTLELLVDVYLFDDTQAHPLSPFARDPEAIAIRHALLKIADPGLRSCLAAVPFSGDLTTTTEFVTADPATQDCQIATQFRIVGLHARGGLGRVSLAMDEQLRRPVAVKEIRPEFDRDETNRERFVREAEITAGLEHPGIVPVYGLGRFADGRPFYAMRFVKGESLQQAIQQFHATRTGGQPKYTGLALRQLLRRFIDVCNTVAYAHSRGVLHRDLKPDNIMLGQYGETLIIDWGLAKAWRDADSSSEASPDDDTLLEFPAASHSAETPPLTQQGKAVGTLAYMSPEQVKGQRAISPAADIYSLGATLYHLLTGRPPHPCQSGEKREDVQKQIVRGIFPLPSTLDRNVPRPLESICLAALARFPEGRYATATELAADIERWLADEPVKEHRERVAERWQRWTRKHRAWVRVGMASLVLITLLAIGSALLINNSYNASIVSYNESIAQRQRRDILAAWNLLEQGNAACMTGDVPKGMFLFLRSLELAEEVEREYTAAGKNPADAASEFMTLPDSPPLSQAIRRQIAAWEPHLIEAGVVLELEAEVTAMAVSSNPVQSVIMVATADGSLSIWDLLSGKQTDKVTGLARIDRIHVSNDGKWLLTAKDAGNEQRLQNVQVWRTNALAGGGKALRTDQIVVALAFSLDNDSAYLLLEDRQHFQNWDVRKGEQTLTGIVNSNRERVPQRWLSYQNPEAGTYTGSGHFLKGIESESAKRMILGIEELEVQLWSDSRSTSPPMRHACPIHAAAFSHDEELVITGSYDGTAKIWRVPRGRLVGHPLPHEKAVNHVAFSADGRLAIVGGGKVVRVWHLSEAVNTRTNDQLSSYEHLLPHGEPTVSLVTPDGSRVVVGTNAGTVHCWDISTSQPVGGVLEGSGAVEQLRWSSAGPLVVFADEPEAIVLFDITQPAVRRRSLPLRSGSLWSVSPDGHLVAHQTPENHSAPPGFEPQLRLTDVRTGSATVADLALKTDVAVSNFTRDSRLLAVLEQGTTRLVDSQTGKVSQDLTWSAQGYQPEPHRLTPDGSTLLVQRDGGITLVNVATGKAAGAQLRHFGSNYQLHYSFTGRGQVLTGAEDQRIRLWDWESGAPRTPPMLINGAVRKTVVNPEGTLAAVVVNFQHIVNESAFGAAAPSPGDPDKPPPPDLRFEHGVQLFDLSTRLTLGKILLSPDLAQRNPALRGAGWKLLRPYNPDLDAIPMSEMAEPAPAASAAPAAAEAVIDEDDQDFRDRRPTIQDRSQPLIDPPASDPSTGEEPDSNMPSFNRNRRTTGVDANSRDADSVAHFSITENRAIWLKPINVSAFAWPPPNPRPVLEGWSIPLPQPEERTLPELKSWLAEATGQIDDPREGPRLMTAAELAAARRLKPNKP